MAIADSLNTIAENVPKVYEAGRKKERDEFWDKYQNYGERVNYAGALAGSGWALTGLLPPKYNLKLKGANNYYVCAYFNNSAKERYDMTEICKMFDTSELTRANSMFVNAKAENITVDISNCTYAIDMFNCGMGGGSIDKVYLKLSEKLTYATSMFAYCYDLETLRFSSDSIIATNISLSSSSKLSKESIINVVNTLSTTATDKTLTLNKTAIKNAFGADYDSSTEWTTLKNGKSNWTITLS